MNEKVVKFVRVILNDPEQTSYDLMYDSVRSFVVNCRWCNGFYWTRDKLYSCCSGDYGIEKSKIAQVSGVYVLEQSIDVVLGVNMSYEEAVRRGYVC